MPATRGGDVRWLPAPDDSGKRVLRQRLDSVTEKARAAQHEADDAAQQLDEQRTVLRSLTADLERSRRSRRRLAELAGRLRRERDAAESALQTGAVAEAWREAPWLRGFSCYVREFGGSRGLSPSLVASGESELVVNTPRYRNARTFPVPVEVHSSGYEFFGAHVKIDRGGGVAPRLHHFDDTRGATGSVRIGYLGPHLPGPESN